MKYVTEESLIGVLKYFRDEIFNMTKTTSPSSLVEYTVIVDQENKDPKTSCTYADDALHMYPGDLWDTMPIFKDIRPCVFKDGAVVYYLNPNDWTQKADGTNSNLLGADGDVMIEFPKCAYRIYTDNNNKVHVSVTNDPSKVTGDNRYSYDAFSRLSLGDRDKIYISAFLGCMKNNVLSSISMSSPVENLRLSQARDAAQAKGAHYQLFTWQQLKLLQCLYLIKYRSRNSKEALGNGCVNFTHSIDTGFNMILYDTTTGIRRTGGNTLKSGMNFGSPHSEVKHMRFLGLEDFWGNLKYWVDGIMLYTDGNYEISWNNFTNENIEATATTYASGFEEDDDVSGINIKYVWGTTDMGFLVKTEDKSYNNEEYWVDYQDAFVEDTGMAFGSDYRQGRGGGAFCMAMETPYWMSPMGKYGVRFSYI